MMDVQVADTTPATDVTSQDATAGSGLVGTWATSSIPGVVPAPNETIVEAITFAADMTANVTLTDTNAAATPGCVHVEQISGTWSTSGTTLTTVMAGPGTTQATMCTNASDNYAMRACMASECSINAGTTMQTYAVSGNTLTLSDSSGGMIVYTRQ
jgi:hypothetical protein